MKVVSHPFKGEIKLKKPSLLKAYSNHARTHSDKQVAQVAASISKFGFINPIIIDKENIIVAGHARLYAAELLKLKSVPTICVEHLSEAQKKAYILADNKLALNSDWDEGALKLEIESLIELNDDIDISITGFDTPEVDIILQKSNPEPELEDEPYEESNGEPVSQLGDIWLLGNHKIVCGDVLDAGPMKRLMGEDKADMVFTDPPYNVKIQGHVCGSGKVKHPEFAMASGEMSSKEFKGFLSKSLKVLSNHSANGSLHYICMDWRHAQELLEAAEPIYSEFKNLCVWNKDNGGMGSMYRSKHELIFLFKNGKAKHVNNIELGKHGRYRTNVWDYPGVNSLKRNRMEELKMHPTVKPVGLVADAILDCTKRQNLVLDVFGGSGTTLLAAEKTGRYARLLELEPVYVDITIQRWQKLTGDKAINLITGKSFEEVKKGKENDNE